MFSLVQEIKNIFESLPVTSKELSFIRRNAREFRLKDSGYQYLHFRYVAPTKEQRTSKTKKVSEAQSSFPQRCESDAFDIRYRRTTDVKKALYTMVWKFPSAIEIIYKQKVTCISLDTILQSRRCMSFRVSCQIYQLAYIRTRQMWND